MTLCFGRELVGDRAVIVDEHWLVAFPYPERVRADGTGSKCLSTDGGDRMIARALSPQAGQSKWDQHAKAEQHGTSFHGFNKQTLPNCCSPDQNLLRLRCGEFTKRAGARGFET